MKEIKLPPGRKFILATHPRSGGNWLIGLLIQHPRVFATGELFERVRKDTGAARFIAAAGIKPLGRREKDVERFVGDFFLRSPAAAQKRVIGFKLLGSHLSRKWRRRLLMHPDIDVILLRRRNLLRACVSHQIAQRTRQFIVGKNQKHRRIPPFRADIAGMRQWLARQAKWLEFCERVLKKSGKAYMNIFYEDLNADPGQAQKVFAFLGVRRFDGLEAATRRVTPIDRYALLRNIDEVEAKLGGGRFGRLDGGAARRPWKRYAVL